MNKTELIETIAEQAGLSKAGAEKAVAAFTNTVTDCLKKGESVVVTGFGTFLTSERPPRKGRNPRTGETIEVPATRGLRFKPSPALKAEVKER